MKKIIYAPTLHSSLAPKGLPEDLLFVCPGLGECPPGAFIPQGLPFNVREARAALEELLALGAAFEAGGDLKFMAGQGWLEREEARKRQLRSEDAAIAEFIKTGAAPGGNRWTRAAASGLPETSQAEQFKNAQKALLLAWEHEESILALRALEARITAGEQRLAASLGDGSPEEAAPATSEQPARPEYSWRVLLDAMSAFLPDGAALFTAFGPMIDDLRVQGVLEPLPGNAAEELAGWPETLTSSLLSASLPMWRLLGYAALPADRPWLGAARELFAASRLPLLKNEA